MYSQLIVCDLLSWFERFQLRTILTLFNSSIVEFILLMRSTLQQRFRSSSFRPETAKLTRNDESRKTGSSNLKRRLNLSDDYGEPSTANRFEKERFQQEQFYLKTTLHAMQEENLRLKTRIYQLEEQNNKQEKMLQELDNIGPVKAQFLKYVQEAHLVNALKKQLINTRQTLISKEDELNQLKKSLKNTQMKELLTEKQALSEECYRLKGLLESTVQASLFTIQGNVQQEVQDRIMNMLTQIQDLKIEKHETEKALQRLKKYCMEQKSTQLDGELKANREIRKLKDNLADKVNQIEAMKPTKKLEDVQNQLMLAERQIKQLNMKISELMQTIEDLERNRFRSEMQESVQEISDNFIELTKSVKMQPIDNHQKSLEDSVKTPISVKKEQLSSFSVQVPKTKKRIIPVTYPDIRHICETLKYKLMAMDIECSQVDEYIFSDDMLADGEVNFKALKEQFQLFPFDLNSSDAHIIARYVIENDEQETTDNSIQQIPFVRSVLRRILGNYKLQVVKNAVYKSEKLRDALTKYKQYIISTIKQMYNAKITRVTKEQFIDVLITLQLELSTPEIDYMIVQGIMQSEGILALNYMEMLKYEPPKIEQPETFLLTQNNNDDYIKVEKQMLTDDANNKQENLEYQQSQQSQQSNIQPSAFDQNSDEQRVEQPSAQIEDFVFKEETENKFHTFNQDDYQYEEQFDSENPSETPQIQTSAFDFNGIQNVEDNLIQNELYVDDINAQSDS